MNEVQGQRVRVALESSRQLLDSIAGISASDLGPRLDSLSILLQRANAALMRAVHYKDRTDCLAVAVEAITGALRCALGERVSACVILLSAGKVAVIQSKKHGYKYELPGGKSDHGETPEATARRECGEEIGFAPRFLRLLFESYVGGYYCHTYLCEDAPPTTLVSGKEGDALWIWTKDLWEYGTYPEHTKRWMRLLESEGR